MNLYDLYTNPEELYGYKELSAIDISDPDEILRFTSKFGIRLYGSEYHLKKYPEYAVKYAIFALEGKRFLEAEPYIMKDPRSASWYAKDVLKRRWKEAEPYIMKNLVIASLYASEVLKRRWKEAEPYIKLHLNSWLYYKMHFGID